LAGQTKNQKLLGLQGAVRVGRGQDLEIQSRGEHRKVPIKRDGVCSPEARKTLQKGAHRKVFCGKPYLAKGKSVTLLEQEAKKRI